MTIKISRNRVSLEDARLERSTLKDYAETTVPVTAASTTNLDCESGNVFLLTHDSDITNLTVINPTASPAACSITIIRTKDASGTARLVTTWTNFKWPGGTVPSLTQTSGAIDIITAFTVNGGTTWYGFFSGAAMA